MHVKNAINQLHFTYLSSALLAIDHVNKKNGMYESGSKLRGLDPTSGVNKNQVKLSFRLKYCDLKINFNKLGWALDHTHEYVEHL